MKILHVNTSATAGGAAIAARRIIRAENRYGLDASLLTRDDDVEISSGRWNFMMERAGVLLNQGLRTRHLWAIDPATHGTDITVFPAFKEADIIHLHWVNQGLLSIADIMAIRRSGKPVVWTMHDMWPFTGICHHADECTAWKDGSHCNVCPYNSRMARRTYQRKEELYTMKGLPITFVGCSQWLTDMARQAPLLSNHPITAIPNPIDTEFYRPLDSQFRYHGGGVVTTAPDRVSLRNALGLPPDRPLILFAAYKASEPGKGLSYLLEATRDMDADLVVLGKQSEDISDTQRKGHIYTMGLITERSQMRQLYQVCDVLAVPTLKDNLPNTIVEAMSCGLPCVGFRIGGVPEMIDHGTNGYLAAYLDTADLRRGLESILQGNRKELQSAARLKAVQTYSEYTVAAKYAHLYEKALTHL